MRSSMLFPAAVCAGALAVAATATLAFPASFSRQMEQAFHHRRILFSKEA